MQKKNLTILVVIIIILAAAIGGYFIFHKSPAKVPVANSSTNSNNKSPATTVNNSVLITKNNSSVGSYLADPNSNTLYTDGSGAAGVSNCTSSCLTAWPPYLDKGSTTGLPTNVSTIKRSDNGEVQYTYKNMPLYYFASDSKGQVTGNGISGFSVATP